MNLISVTKIKLTALYDIITSGFPTASGQLFLTIKLLFINTLISLIIGKAGLAAFAVCYNSLFIIYIFLIGTAQSMSPIVSIYNQEKDFAGVKFTIQRSLKIVLVSGTIFTLIFLLFPTTILNIFGVRDPSDIAVGINALRIFSLSIIGTGVTFLMMFYTQAIQHKKFSFIISITEGLLIPIPAALLLSRVIGADGIWISFFLAEVGTIILILFATRLISKRSDGKFSGFFMLGNHENAPVLDVTIRSSVDDVVGLSEKLMDFAWEK